MSTTTLPRPSAHDVRRLAVDACRDSKTVERWYRDPNSVRPVVATALEAAAARLGLPVPPRTAARALVRRGTLRAAKIGRRLYAKRSDLLALVDALAARSDEQRPTADDPKDVYAALVARARRGAR